MVWAGGLIATAALRQVPSAEEGDDATFRRLSAPLESPDPALVAAAREKLGAWLEQLERATFSKGSRDIDALSLLCEGAMIMAQLPDPPEAHLRWFALVERATLELPASDMRRFFHTGLRLARANDALEREQDPLAREWIQSALADNPHPRVRPLALLTLAELQRRAGKKVSALETLDEAEVSLEAIGGGAVEGEARANLELLRAYAQLDLGLPDLAWSSFERAQVLARKLPTRGMLDKTKLFEVNLLLAVNRSETVVKRLRPALDANGKRPPLTLELELRLGIALADLECVAPGSAPEAVGLIESVIAREQLSIDERRIGHIALVDFYVRKNDAQAALRNLGLARKELDQVQQVPGSRTRAREKAELEAYSSCLLRREKFEPQAGRKQLLLLQDAFREFIEQLRHDEFRPGGVGFLHFATRRFILNELILLSIAVLGDERGFEDALEALIQAQELGSLSRALTPVPSLSGRLASPACTPASARKLLTRDGGGVLIFLPDYHRTLVLAFDAKRGGLCVSADSRDKLDPLINKWRREVTTPPRSLEDKALEANLKAITELGKQLAPRLLPTGIRERLAGWNSVTILGADLMDDLPFEALPLVGEQTLGIQLAVDHAPSLSVAVKLAQRRALPALALSSRAGLWLVAAPTFPDWADESLRELAQIPFSEEDRQALQRHYPKLGHNSFVGLDATRSALEDSRLSLASVLQVTAHGAQALGEERRAALALRPMSPEDDGLLTCAEVEQLLVPDTVVLSTCEAARGAQRYGEDGLTHLGGAFMMAGASCVVLSPYPVEAQAMQALMVVFHQRLCAGDTRAESMRAARADVSRNPRFSHPYYHSLVLVVGLGQTTR